MTATGTTAAPVLVFDEPTDYHRCDYETASTWSRYVIEPGEYPVEFTTIDGAPVREGERGYYGVVRVRARRVEHSYVNRLFNASSAHHEHTPDAPVETLSRNTYAYNFEDTALPARGDRPEQPMPRFATFFGGRVEYRRQA